ncbi:hypothetical protein [Thermoflexus sp.]|uniref:hypothetical protein n=1 Tax=Thermoflexus sp. TaxID=1969742 RepID=UPI0026185A45|nr:hypothetical protein [Thermoflexus sp.]MCX7691449.1 hypothetical protein [Thermoflexus sp.]
MIPSHTRRGSMQRRSGTSSSSGLEALDERLNTTSHDAMIGRELFYWPEYGYNQEGA